MTTAAFILAALAVAANLFAAALLAFFAEGVLAGIFAGAAALASLAILIGIAGDPSVLAPLLGASAIAAAAGCAYFYAAYGTRAAEAGKVEPKPAGAGSDAPMAVAAAVLVVLPLAAALVAWLA